MQARIHLVRSDLNQSAQVGWNAGTLSTAESQNPTIIAGYSLAIAKALDSYGVDSGRILRAAAIPQAVSNDPLVRLPVETLTRLYRMCVEVTHDPYFGLTVAKFVHISNLHALGHALASSSTLMDFCRRVQRYFRLASQTASATLTESSDEVSLRFKLLVEVSGETEDALLGFVVLAMRQLHKSSFNPSRVEMHHAMPREGSAPYEKLFRAPVSFGAADVAVVFPKAELMQSLAGACPELAQFNDNIATGYLARLDRQDVVTNVRQKIVEFLPSGDCTRDKVAQALCMSPTNLHLKLSQRDTSFQDLLNDTRKELACSYMRQSSRAVTEIAFTLGFTDTSNFTRAFKRWTGVSPTDFRHQM